MSDVLITQEDCAKRIEWAMRDLRRDMAELQVKLRQAEYRATIAEWAVAGVISRGINIKFSLHPGALSAARDLHEISRRIGMEAGAYFLNKAELAFRDHAELTQLRMQSPPHRHLQHTSSEPGPRLPYRECWPRPFPP